MTWRIKQNLPPAVGENELVDLAVIQCHIISVLLCVLPCFSIYSFLKYAITANISDCRGLYSYTPCSFYALLSSYCIILSIEYFCNVSIFNTDFCILALISELRLGWKAFLGDVCMFSLCKAGFVQVSSQRHEGSVNWGSQIVPPLTCV